MGCHKMAQENSVSGRQEWSTLLNFSERSSNTRTENCPLDLAKWRFPVSQGRSAAVGLLWFEERAGR